MTRYDLIRTVLFLILFPLFFGPGFAQNHQERLAQIDVQHYAFDLVLRDKKDDIKCVADVTVMFKQAVSEFDLDLVQKNDEGKGMTVLRVEENEKEIAFEHSGETLTLKLDAAAEKGEQRTFNIIYHGIPADGLIISKNKHGDRTFFGDNWPDRAHHYLPCVDHPSDKATVEFNVTAPKHYNVVANGVLVEASDPDDDFHTVHWKTDVVLPTKVMVIGAADFAVSEPVEVEGIPVTSWVFKQQREEGFYDYAQAVPILKWFIDKVAEYPYEKLANVQSKTRYGGMENASCIFYAESSVTGKRTAEALLAHEIAHQWFGNSASEANWHHVWLSEGFATYFTHLYYEENYNRSVFQERMRADRDRVVMYNKRSPAPVVDVSVEDYNRLLNPNSYQKGGWVLHMLRREVGEEAFMTGIKAYYAKYQFGNALTEDLQRVMEETSGKDLGQFFKQWIYSAGHPDLQIISKYDNAKKEIVAEIIQKQDTLFSFPLDLHVQSDDIIAPEGLTVQITGRKTTVRLPASPDDQLAADPNVWLLAEIKFK